MTDAGVHRSCEICGNTFVGSNARQRRCSSACVREGKRRWTRRKHSVQPHRRPGAMMQCQRCGLALQRTGPTQKYCAPCKKIIDKDVFRRSKGTAAEDGLGVLFVCLVCGETTSRTGPRQKYCSDACYAEGMRQLVRKHHPPLRSYGTQDACVTCGQGFIVSSATHRYCSKVCATRAANGRKRQQFGRTQFVGIEFVCTICHRTAVRTTGPQIYCSKDCARRAHYQKRTKKIQTHLGLPYTRRQIFARDKWTCQSCRKKVRDNVSLQHPSRSTIDHIVPLSQGGPECASNVHTLCWPCNHRKGNRIGKNDQLRLKF
jgi:5-methylcytosine-specific restriction enzyme A